MNLREKELPLVSIIVVTYNSAKYVLETLESTRLQTYQKIELIVSDDCSLDDTVELCCNWIDKHKTRFVRTELIKSQTNLGIPSNCNRGLFASQGDWLKFIAGDDVLLPNCIQVNIEYLLSRPDIKVLLSNVKIYLNTFEDHNFLDEKVQSKPKFYFNESISAKEQYNLLLKGDFIATTPSLVIEGRILKTLNGFDERFKLIEDYPLWLKLTQSGYKIHFMDRITVNYRKSSTAINNMIQPFLIKPAFFRNEQLRKIYVYPNLSIWAFIYQKYYYYSALLFKYLTGNKHSILGCKIFGLLTFKFNPVRYIFKWGKKLK